MAHQRDDGAGHGERHLRCGGPAHVDDGSGQATVTYGYDNADLLTSVTQGTSTVTLGYDLAGRRASLALPNGITTTYGYDAANHLTSLTWATGAGTLGDLTYTCDEAAGRGWVAASRARTFRRP